jgi:hypothetical protein
MIKAEIHCTEKTDRRSLMNGKVKDLRKGMRLDLKKPPKTEIPKNVYNRKVKHKKGQNRESSAPFFLLQGMGNRVLFAGVVCPGESGLPRRSGVFLTRAGSCIRI